MRLASIGLAALVAAVLAATIFPSSADARHHRKHSHGASAATASKAGAKAGPAQCTSTPDDVLAVDTTVDGCLISGVDCAGIDHLKVFDNREHRLPALASGQAYREARVGAKPGDPGPRRIVVLLKGAQGSGAVLQHYYTADHYGSFCAFQPAK